jgi:hypothetical protein
VRVNGEIVLALAQVRDSPRELVRNSVAYGVPEDVEVGDVVYRAGTAKSVVSPDRQPYFSSRQSQGHNRLALPVANHPLLACVGAV